MSKPSLYQDTNYLKTDQYKDSQNLGARATLHRDYTVSVSNWQPWVFNYLELQPGDRVLECGCGPAWLWRENLDRIPADCHLTLTDLSAGMIAEAEAALASTHHSFHWQTADIQALPFETDAFDVVVANHMLYHVPDLPKGLAQVRRVLRPGGRFIAATNGQGHMGELFSLSDGLPTAIIDETLPLRHTIRHAFSLENGQAQLEPFFNHITLHRYDSHLSVAEVEPIVAYLASSTKAQALLTDELLQAVRARISQVIAEKGAFHITKATGLFVAQ